MNNQIVELVFWIIGHHEKKDNFKTVLDARHINSNPDQPSESLPLDPLATQLSRECKKTVIGFMYAYGHASLED